MFQHVIDKMLDGMQNESILAYMETYLFPWHQNSQALLSWKESFSLVADAGLKLNLAKCFFLKAKLRVFGVRDQWRWSVTR